ncbi:MAG: NCS2 family permease, partial [Prevotella sp.]|nr:NCS2 family permease [Prevotella sp.]
LFFSPIFLMIPSAATTSALFLVGVMMMRPVLNIDFVHFRTGMPCFITMIMMPFTASISEGIVLGMLSYIIVKVCIGEGRQLSWFMYVLGALFILKYVAPLL